VFTLLVVSAKTEAATGAEPLLWADNAHAEQSHTEQLQIQTKPSPHSLSSTSSPQFRFRSCFGLDPTCIGGGIQADLSGDAVGFNLGLSVFPLVIIPIPSLNVSLRTFFRQRSTNQSGLYGYAAGSVTVIFFPVFAYGVGVGWEVEMGRKRHVLMQPQLGLSMMQAPGGASLDYSSLLPYPVPTASLSFVRAR
jgi:hypothetical protein